MASEIAAMLDELMGRDRDMLPSEKRDLPKFSDSDVCKYYLLGMCPHDLFVNTRSDLGTLHPSWLPPRVPCRWQLRNYAI